MLDIANHIFIKLSDRILLVKLFYQNYNSAVVALQFFLNFEGDAESAVYEFKIFE